MIGHQLVGHHVVTSDQVDSMVVSSAEKQEVAMPGLGLKTAKGCTVPSKHSTTGDDPKESTS